MTPLLIFVAILSAIGAADYVSQVYCAGDRQCSKKCDTEITKFNHCYMDDGGKSSAIFRKCDSNYVHYDTFNTGDCSGASDKYKDPIGKCVTDYATSGSLINSCKTGNPPAPPPPPPPPPLHWPKFASAAALKASPWASYYQKVYGGLPTTFPVQTADFWVLYAVELVNAKVTNAPASVGTCPTAKPPLGQRYDVNNRYVPPFLSWIWHPYPYKQLAANKFVEVFHRADPFGDEHYGSWLIYAPGSGIYFNLGKTIAFAEHQDAYTHFGIKQGDPHPNEDLSKACASQGYDSIQFLAHVDHVNYQCDTHNSGRAGLKYMGLEVLACKLVGTYACSSAVGAPSVIRAGWQGSKACKCDNKQDDLNCAGVPTFTGHTSTNEGVPGGHHSEGRVRWTKYIGNHTSEKRLFV